MDKRTLIAIFLIIIVFWISSEFIWKNNNPVNNAQTTEQANVNTQPIETTNDTGNSSAPKNDENEYIQSLEDIPEIDIVNNLVLENDRMRLEFSNLGGVLKSIKLKDYFRANKENLAQLIPAEESILGLKVEDDRGSIHNLTKRPFNYSYRETGILVFVADTELGRIEKVFTVGEGYELDFNLNIDGNVEPSGYELDLSSGIADTEDFLKMKTREYKTVFQLDNEKKTFTLAKLKKQNQSLKGSIDWAAVKSKYFVMGIIPDELIDMNKISAFSNSESPAMNLGVKTSRADVRHQFKLYLGPLIYDNLKDYGNGFDQTVDLGPKFLQLISKFFITVLRFIHGFIPNWGLVLIVFSILLKIVLYPLTHKSFESSTKMQKVNPYIKEIQAKYKSDPQTMNAEVKKLYKEHGVNPLGGCLPMLLQMPILFALYPILRYSIDLRQTKFLWLPDLSEPDPIWALPILMAVFMFVQQKLMAPSKDKLAEMDEKQQAAQQSQKMMMYFMPIMMFFIFKSLASGLVLYWTVFSIIGTVQQIMIKRKFS